MKLAYRFASIKWHVVPSCLKYLPVQDELGAVFVVDLSTKVVREKYQKLSCNRIIGSWMIS